MYTATINIDNEFTKLRFTVTRKNIRTIMWYTKRELIIHGYPTKNVILVKIKNRDKEWSIMHGKRYIGWINYDSGTNE